MLNALPDGGAELDKLYRKKFCFSSFFHGFDWVIYRSMKSFETITLLAKKPSQVFHSQIKSDCNQFRKFLNKISY